MSTVSDNRRRALLGRMREIYGQSHSILLTPSDDEINVMLELLVREVEQTQGQWAALDEMSAEDRDVPRYEADLTRDQLLGTYSARVWYIDEDGVRSYIGSPFGLAANEESIVRAATRMAKLHKDGGTVRLDV